jgi:hypothetical protein
LPGGAACAADRSVRGVIGVVKQGINGLVAFEVKQAQGLPFLLQTARVPRRDHMAIDGLFGTTVTGDNGHRSLLTGQKVGCWERALVFIAGKERFDGRLLIVGLYQLSWTGRGAYSVAGS